MKDKLLIVTDLGRFKAYKIARTLEGTWQIALLKEVVLEEAHHRVLETVTDLAGRRGGGAMRGAAPLADEHSLRLETKRHLVRQIARHMAHFIELEKWGECWLAADKEINHQILAELPPSDGARIRKNLPRDLTKVADKDLLELFLKV
jgi:hypothetical protein